MRPAVRRAATAAAAAGACVALVLGGTPGAALAAQVQYWNGNTSWNQMKYSADLASLVGGVSHSPGQGLIADIYTLDIGGRVEYSASSSAGAATLTHPRTYNTFSGCRWSAGLQISGTGRLQCWYKN